MSPWRAALSAMLLATPSLAQEIISSPVECEICPEVIALPGGTFLMGSPLNEEGRDEHEALPHEVDVDPFALTVTEITVAAFVRFADATGLEPTTPCWTHTIEQGWSWRADASWRDPLFPQTPDHPVTCVSWDEATAYAAWLSVETSETWRLPTEAEWEYAARAGTQGPRYWQGSREDVCVHANINDLSGKNFIWKVGEPCDDGWLYTSSVGFFATNPFGFHDMQGNVWEWVQDCFEGDTPSLACNERILRGGAWMETPGAIRISIREWRAQHERMAWAGFRLVQEMATTPNTQP